jgi:CheY-like chemotaxis protein
MRSNYMVARNGQQTNCQVPIKCIAIDDDNFSLSVLERFCDKLPCISLESVFNNPLEALNYLRVHQPDLVFLDINMPVLDGYQATKQIKVW